MLTLPLFPDSDNTPFDRNRHVDENGQEFWSARELMPMLGYAKWQNFKPIIEKAKTACSAAGYNLSWHFGLLPSVTQSGKGRIQEVEDFKLSRYACHLIAMNGDPSKPAIAQAQTYFSVQTRRAELARQNPKELKRAEAVTGYQLSGHSQTWSSRRVDTKESTKALNAKLQETHTAHKPDYGVVSAAQNEGLYAMSKSALIDYLGLTPSQAHTYRDYLGQYVLEATKLSSQAATKKMADLGRELTTDEQSLIVGQMAERAARIMREAADMLGVDYLSGAPLDESGRALMPRQTRLLTGGSR